MLKFFAIFLSIFILATESYARAGGGRSSGRSGGSRPARVAPQPRGEAPPQNSSNNSDVSQRQQTPPGQQPGGVPPQQPQRPSFMRNMLGGMAGGFLGSALFSSLGFGSGLGGGGRGGMGLFEIILLALAGFGIYRYFKMRRQPLAESGPSVYSPSASTIDLSQSRFMRDPQPETKAESIPTDLASDIFFKVQTAWTKRDLSRVQENLSPQISSTFSEDLQTLIRERKINRLENIAVREVKPLESWTDAGTNYSSVYFLANLLDYKVDEATGAVIEGSDRDPVKFEEEWTFEKAGNTWRLCEIQQIA